MTITVDRVMTQLATHPGDSGQPYVDGRLLLQSSRSSTARLGQRQRLSDDRRVFLPTTYSPTRSIAPAASGPFATAGFLVYNCSDYCNTLYIYVFATIKCLESFEQVNKQTNKQTNLREVT